MTGTTSPATSESPASGRSLAEDLRAVEPHVSRGKLRVYVGAAPGVGKTYAALEEIHQLVDQGVDAVIGYVETHGRADTAALLDGLEVIPRRPVFYRGARFHEMDPAAIIERAPEVALVDELAHTNVPGVEHAKRWEDVEPLLAAGIDVISTVNIQHFESLNDVVEEITGVSQRETIPDEVVRRADEIHLVDLTQQAIRERMVAGKIYPAERVDAALTNFFRPGNLGALRELALSWTADRVEEAVEEYRRHHGIDSQWETRERVVVGITGRTGGEDTIRRAARMAMRSRGDLFGVFVRSAEGLAEGATPGLEEQRELLERLGGQYHEVTGAEVGEALVNFARANNATQLVVGATGRSRLQEFVSGSVIQRVLRTAGDIDVHVISNPEAPMPVVAPRRSTSLPLRRRIWGWVTGAVGFSVATVVLLEQRGEVDLQNVLLVYLSIAAGVAWIGGFWPALTAALIGFVLGNYLFTPPVQTWSIADGDDVFALAAFISLAGLIGLLVGSTSRRSAEAAAAKAEAETLAALIGAGGEGSPQKLIERLQVALDAQGVSLLAPGPDGIAALAIAGDDPPASPAQARRVVSIGRATLAIAGEPLDSVDERLLSATVTELGAVIDRAQLAEHAADAEALSRANELRTALLRTISHDLRSPLSAIRASVTSLLQDDVVWPEEEQRGFLSTINDETERLNRMVSDLLDAGRLQAGVMTVRHRLTSIEEVIAALVTTFQTHDKRISFDIDPGLPDITTDPGLLERILENLIRNALDHSPPHTPVRVAAEAVGNRIDLRVIDRGPGIDPSLRDRIFEPFQTLDDSHIAGVGLGLSVAMGLAQALGCELLVDDTPGGGTTMTVSVGVDG